MRNDQMIQSVERARPGFIKCVLCRVYYIAFGAALVIGLNSFGYYINMSIAVPYAINLPPLEEK